MTLLYPSFLFALFSLSIPIIIHLYNFRRYKTLLFSNVSFLKTISQETKASSQLRHWLILLCRILALASLVIAFSQPIIPTAPGAENSHPEAIALYLDNSFSMEGEGNQGKLLEMAKSKARRAVGAFRPGTRFLFTNNNFEPQHQHFVSREQILEFIASTELSPNPRLLSEVYSRQRDYLFQNLSSFGQTSTGYFISDFQQSTANFSLLKSDSGLSVQLIPIETQAPNNLFIDSCWFESPYRQFGQPDEIRVKIVNGSAQAYSNIPLKLFLNDSLKSVSGFNIGPMESITATLAFRNTTKGWINARVEINDYPVTFDNAYFFSYRIAERLDILVIGSESTNRYFRLLFEEDDYFKVTLTSENAVNYSGLSEYETVILNEPEEVPSGLAEALRQFTANGGTLALFPSPAMDRNSINPFLTTIGSGQVLLLDTAKTTLSKINYSSSIFQQSLKEIPDRADYPLIFQRFRLSLPASGAEILLATETQSPVMFRHNFKKGKVFVSAIPLRPDFSNLVKHPLFVPTLYNMVLQSVPSIPLSYFIGKDESIDLMSLDMGNQAQLRITGTDTRFDLIPESRRLEGVNKLFLGHHLRKAGNYSVSNGDTAVAAFSYNYDRAESDLQFFDPAEVKEQLALYQLSGFRLLDVTDDALPQAIIRANQGTPLWKWFILAALLFLAIEIALARLWK